MHAGTHVYYSVQVWGLGYAVYYLGSSVCAQVFVLGHAQTQQ